MKNIALEIAAKIASFGAAGTVFFAMILYAGTVLKLSGAAAIAWSLATLGPGGMVGGVLFLIAVAIASETILKEGLRYILKAVMDAYECKGVTVDDIRKNTKDSKLPKNVKTRFLKNLEEHKVSKAK